MKKKIGVILLLIVIISNITFSINAAGLNEDVSLPNKFNTLDTIKLNVIDQGITDNCWGITMTELMELAYAKKNNLTNNPVLFSSRHMENACSNVLGKDGFTRDVGSSGRYEYGLSYFASGKGPILESEMPFVNTKDAVSTEEVRNKTPQVCLKNYTEYPFIYKYYDENNNIIGYSNGEIGEKRKEYSDSEISDFRKQIKNQILTNGAVGAITYYSPSKNYFSEEEGYKLGASYFCNGTNTTQNHIVVIVGWDDTYSRNNFKEGCRPQHDGAYIALSSWGTTWNSRGDGTYYISYDDALVERRMVGITEISDIDYDNIYQYDQFGENYNLGAKDQSFIFGANVYEKNDYIREEINSIGLYIVNDNTNVKIYLNQNGDDLSKLQEVGSADDLTTGYHSIKLDDSYLVGEKFVVAVRYENLKSRVCVPLEANYTSLGSPDMQAYNNVKSNQGESFYSLNGTDWYDFYNRKISDSTTLIDVNACIKAFTESEEKKNQGIINNNIKIIEINNKKYIVGFNEGFTGQNLVDSFDTNYNVSLGNGLSLDSRIGTGNSVFVSNNGHTEEYVTILYGDVTRDGQINSADALAIIKDKLGITKFDNDASIEAAKVTLDTRLLNSKPSAVDALGVIKHKLNIKSIS